jgi:Zn-dependent protease
VTFPNLQVLIVAVGALGLLVGLAVGDSIFILTFRQPIGRWVEAWSRRFPILAFLLAAVFGLLVGHLYWSTPPTCPVTAQGQILQAGTDRDCIPPHSGPPPNT